MLFEGLACSSCTKNQKVYRGCTTQAYDPYMYGDRELTRCPVHEITELSYFMIRMYTHYNNGFLLTHGGITDQPLQYLEAMEAVRSQYDECEQAKAAVTEGQNAAMDKVKGLNRG